MMTKRLRWYRWTVIVVGRESGNRTPPFTFVRFRHKAQAVNWCARINTGAGSDLAYFEPVEMP